MDMATHIQGQKERLFRYIEDTYSTRPEHPFSKYHSYTVYRKQFGGSKGSKKKWFALFMDVPYSKLHIKGEGVLDILNVKCDSTLIESLLHEEGFLPAYHMNKAKWLSIRLDGSVEDEYIHKLLEESYKAV